MNRDKIDYFIDRTDLRLAGIERDIKRLISFRMMLLGGSAVISAIVSMAALYLWGR